MEEETSSLQVPEDLKENVERILREKDINAMENGITQWAKMPVQKSTAKSTSIKSSGSVRQPLLTALAIEADNGQAHLVQKLVFHSGVPVKLSGPFRHTTTVQPFSFEERNKAAQKKKQEKLQKIKDEAEKQHCTVFHARPVPAYLKPNRLEK